jgi:peptidyl-prolyl cis-trans isomerase SurA
LKNREYILEISGHRDASENDTLSEARINYLVSQLKSKGVLSTHLMEKDEAALVRASKTDKSKNARVTFKFYSQSMDDVVKRFNSIKPGSLEAKEGYFLPGENSLMDVSGELGVKTIDQGTRKVVYEIKQKEPERLKSVDEARTTIIRNMQIELEKNWLNKLKNQYPAQIQYNELDALMK